MNFSGFDVSVPDPDPVILLLMLVLGLVMAFFGAKIIRTLAMAIGAFIGLVLALYISVWFLDTIGNLGLGNTLCILIAAVIGMIVGALLGEGILHYMIAAFFAQIALSVASLFTENLLVLLIVGLVVFLLVLFIIEEVLAVITALFGGALVGQVALFALGAGTAGVIALLAITVILGGIGASYQMQQERSSG